MPLRTMTQADTAMAVFEHWDRQAGYEVEIQTTVVVRRRDGTMMMGAEVEEMYRSLGMNVPWEPGAPDPTIDDAESLGINIDNSDFHEHAQPEMANVPQIKTLRVRVTKPAAYCVPVPGVGWVAEPSQAVAILQDRYHASPGSAEWARG